MPTGAFHAEPLMLDEPGRARAASGRSERSATDDDPRVVLAPARYVLLPVASVITGYSVKAIERKIERGDWQENKVWIRAPDGRIVIDLTGYQRWVEGR